MDKKLAAALTSQTAGRLLSFLTMFIAVLRCKLRPSSLIILSGGRAERERESQLVGRLQLGPLWFESGHPLQVVAVSRRALPAYLDLGSSWSFGVGIELPASAASYSRLLARPHCVTAGIRNKLIKVHAHIGLLWTLSAGRQPARQASTDLVSGRLTCTHAPIALRLLPVLLGRPIRDRRARANHQARAARDFLT